MTRVASRSSVLPRRTLRDSGSAQSPRVIERPMLAATIQSLVKALWPAYSVGPVSLIAGGGDQTLTIGFVTSGSITVLWNGQPATFSRLRAETRTPSVSALPPRNLLSLRSPLSHPRHSGQSVARDQLRPSRLQPDTHRNSSGQREKQVVPRDSHDVLRPSVSLMYSRISAIVTIPPRPGYSGEFDNLPQTGLAGRFPRVGVSVTESVCHQW